MSLQCIDPLLQLALLAADDPDACPVLGDYMLENPVGWLEFTTDVFNVVRKINRPISVSEWTPRDLLGISKFFEENAIAMSCEFARGLAAVLLFKAFQEEPWFDFVQISLHSAQGQQLRKEDFDRTEIKGEWYRRQYVNFADFRLSDDGEIVNTKAIVFPKCTNEGREVVTHFVARSSRLHLAGPLIIALHLHPGVTARFDPENLTITYEG